jgi:hypothetical protein
MLFGSLNLRTAPDPAKTPEAAHMGAGFWRKSPYSARGETTSEGAGCRFKSYRGHHYSTVSGGCAGGVGRGFGGPDAQAVASVPGIRRRGGARGICAGPLARGWGRPFCGDATATCGDRIAAHGGRADPGRGPWPFDDTIQTAAEMPPNGQECATTAALPKTVLSQLLRWSPPPVLPQPT